MAGKREAPSGVKAVLGPTNTGKTHLAIERMCAHSSGMMGFPLRLLAREVYDRVVKIKGEASVALITGEERIEPPKARYFLCTMEAMPVLSGRPVDKHRPADEQRDVAFVGIDEAQLGADRERGHIFTDRLLHARGREETMILGSSTLAPIVKALIPGVETITRPRFSTLSHAGTKKLSRLPPRSAIVAFSVEQVYAIAEMLRRFRGGAAVVMGGLSPQTRNAQVALYQSGEVDYLVATDAVGMGLNLDVQHVAFAGLSKFDGQRHRRLTPAEMAQIAGRAGRHQTDGTFGTLSGSGGHDSEFDDEEVYAIEEHRFAPITRLFWRNPEPRFDTLTTLIADLETPPSRPEMVIAPEAIDLAVLKRLADDEGLVGTISGAGQIRRFWDVCRLPDFRQQGVETHSRFIARLWQDLRDGQLGTDYMSAQIAHLDRTGGDIDTLQGRIAAIRSFAYIAQRPDWVLAREEMAERTRAVEARLSDALHGRLTERFINRRTAILMKNLGPDSGLLSIRLEDEEVLVEGEHIGSLRGFTFHVDPGTRLTDRKLLLAAAERHLPTLLQTRASTLAAAIEAELGEDKTAPASGLSLVDGALVWEGEAIAQLKPGRTLLTPQLAPDRTLDPVPSAERKTLVTALESWCQRALAPLAPLVKLDEASRSEDAGPELRALLILLVERCGMTQREESGVEAIDKERRSMLAKLGVRVGALDLFVPALLRTHVIALWRQLAVVAGQRPGPEPEADMPPTLPAKREGRTPGYRYLGDQLIRLDMAEKLLREAYEARSAKREAGKTAKIKAAKAEVVKAETVTVEPASAAEIPAAPEAEVPEAIQAPQDATATQTASSGAETTAPADVSAEVSTDVTKPVEAAAPPRQSRDATFTLDTARAISMGLTEASFERLMRTAGFQALPHRALAEGAFGPSAPLRWRWRPARRDDTRRNDTRRNDGRRNDSRRQGEGRGPRGAQQGERQNDGRRADGQQNDGRRNGHANKPAQGERGERSERPSRHDNRSGGQRSGESNHKAARPERPGEPARAPGAFAALAELMSR